MSMELYGTILVSFIFVVLGGIIWKNAVDNDVKNSGIGICQIGVILFVASGAVLLRDSGMDLNKYKYVFCFLLAIVLLVLGSMTWNKANSNATNGNQVKSSGMITTLLAVVFLLGSGYMVYQHHSSTGSLVYYF